MEDRINPAYITYKENGKKYTLDFCRESVVFAERRGFKLEDVGNFPITGSSDLFYYSFRMHHKSVSHEKTDEIMKNWGGLPPKLINRLIDLYQQAMVSNVIQDEDDVDPEKNAAVTMEL